MATAMMTTAAFFSLAVFVWGLVIESGRERAKKHTLNEMFFFLLQTKVRLGQQLIFKSLIWLNSCCYTATATAALFSPSLSHSLFDAMIPCNSIFVSIFFSGIIMTFIKCAHYRKCEEEREKEKMTNANHPLWHRTFGLLS